MKTLTPTQSAVLSWLGRYKYLCTQQIHIHFFQGKTLRNTEIMLARLEKAELIHRIRTPRSPNFNFGMICYLSKRGFQWVTQNNDFESSLIIHQPVKKPITSLNHYYHRKRLVDFFIQLDKSVSQLPDIQLSNILIESQQIAKGSKRMVATNFSESGVSIIPDMAFSLRNSQGLETAYMVEIDTGRETIGGKYDDTPKGSLIEKCINYEKLLSKSIWKERLETSAEAFEVLIITERPSHGKTILNRIGQRLEYPELYFVSTHSIIEMGQNVLMQSVWMRMKGGTGSIL